MVDLLAGTSDGVLVLSENGGWRIDARHLQGSDVSQIARTADPQIFLVASRGAGLSRLDIRTGKAGRLGVGVLPDKIRCAAVSPGDPNTIFVGAEPVGIFVSRDGGKSWTEAKDVAAMAKRLNWGYPVPSVPPHIRDIVIDRANPNRVIAAVQVGAIIISEDGGKTWRHIAGQLDQDVHGITQDPANAATLYACAGGGGALDMKTMDQYPPPLPEGRPIYRSDDAGQTWQCISLDFDRTYGVGLRVHPRDPSLLLSAVARGIPPFWGKRPERADATVVVSRDGGKTWKQATDGLPARFELMVEAIEIAPGGRHRAFIGTGGEGMKMAGGAKAEIYVSDDVRSWRRIPLDVPPIASLTAL